MTIQDVHDPVVTDVAWSPDGSQLATVGTDGLVKIIDALSGTTLVTLTKAAIDSGPNYVAWNQSGTRLASATLQTVEAWDLTTEESILNETTTGFIYNIVWKSDDQLLYSDADVQSVTLGPICTNPNPINDTAALVSEITAGNIAAAPYTICLENSSYTLTQVDNGLPVITGDITIIGNGATVDFRFFNVAASGSLTLKDMIVSNAYPNR
jgi:WD40 repeat protein